MSNQAASFPSDLELVQSLKGMDPKAAKDDPEALTTAARLIVRYEPHPEVFRALAGLVKNHWGLSRNELNARCREIWASGWRPGQESAAATGSGYDTQGEGS